MIYKKGDRIELISMPNDPRPIEPGTRGTVESVCDAMGEVQLWVQWDNGRQLAVILPHDSIRKIMGGKKRI